VDVVGPHDWVEVRRQGEKLLLIALLYFGAVGSYNPHAFYASSYGEFAEKMAAIGNELFYLALRVWQSSRRTRSGSSGP
jgi:hypothetical protein